MPDLFFKRLCVLVVAVGALVAFVCILERSQHLRVNPGVIIASEAAPGFVVNCQSAPQI